MQLKAKQGLTLKSQSLLHNSLDTTTCCKAIREEAIAFERLKMAGIVTAVSLISLSICYLGAKQEALHTLSSSTKLLTCHSLFTCFAIFCIASFRLKHNIVHEAFLAERALEGGL
jgi:hypothetical protein